MRLASTNLLFHLVHGAGERPAGSPGLSVSASGLGDGLERLLAAGRRAAALGEVVAAAEPAAGLFTVTFDDAHPSVLELAVPVLAELGVPATVFVPTGSVGETPRVAGWAELRALARAPGITIGSHGEAHARMGWRLYREGAADHLARLAGDARRSRRTLEDRLGRAPDLFAYPFGEAPPAARRAVAEAGYRAAFTVAETAEWDGDPMGIPRLDGSTVLGLRGGREPGGEPLGISVVVPACDRPAVLAEVVRRLAEQSYPEDRYEVIVVDDGSRVALGELLAPWLGERVRLLRLPGSEASAFRAGQARQAGAEAARFELLAFLDADVAVDREFLWHLAWPHGRSPDAVVLGYLSGYNLHDLGFVHRLAEISREERLTGDLVPVVPDRSREPALRACLDDLQGLDEPWRLAYTGNLSVRRALLARAGGFAPEFRGWGFEDLDLGLRLHEAGASWVFSRWALGYHLADPEEEAAAARPRNPFRDRRPEPERFAPVLRNLETLEARHPGHAGVRAFCAQVRSDVAETCSRPGTVGVEVGAPYPFDWPFARLHKAQPGGLPLEEVLDRLAYAAKVGARALWLLGGDVALRPELGAILEAARRTGASRVTIETTAIPLAEPGAAEALGRKGVTAAVVEVLAGRGHPRRDEAVRLGAERLAAAGLRLGAKLVVGEDDRAALEAALGWAAALALPVEAVVVLDPRAAALARELAPAGAELTVVASEKVEEPGR